MKPIIFLTLISFSLISATSSEEAPLDKCHTPFDISLDSASAKHVTETISISKAMTFDQVYFTYDQCREKRSDKMFCDKFRVVIAPAEGPARMISISDSRNATVPKNYIEKYKDLDSGDRIIYEGITYTADDKTYELRPVVFIIE